ncbi:polysaccharide biosynthesis/export family protein [Mesorhizobium sp. IMUNJ 23232]|uniref:polysaccharide biosynthesis/export family protein n=1 Tax=Mesorhizobium sp. IMUNJ 23232 TaxID=3376064 RepID=UPI0037BCF5A0
MTTVSKNFKAKLSASTSICAAAAAALLLFGPPALATEPQAAPVEGTVASDTVGAITPTTSGTGAGEAAAKAVSGEELMIGDKVRVSFFEQFDLGQGADAGLTTDARTFYQRLDLTGEHVVGADGEISIPLLGRFKVAQETPEEASAKIVQAYDEIMGRTGQVDIAILERKPVFVTGIVKAPGSFRFEPGMVVLQVIALAGGYDRGAEAAARLLEAQRERERHAQAVDRLQWLIAKRARLMQQHDSQNGKGEKQSNADDGEGPNKAMEGELRLLDAELTANLGADGLQKARLAYASGQVETMNSLLDLLARQIDVRSERLRVLQTIQGRGFSTLETLWNAQKDVSDLQMQRERLVAELGSAKHNIVQTEAEGTKLVADRRVLIQRELAGIEEEINQQRTIVEAAEKMIAALETATSGARLGEPLHVSILRRTPGKTEIMAAEETTDLFPGDVVKVEVVSGSDAVVTSANTL